MDRFRGRLVVPIRDHRGTVIGFGARDLSDSQVSMLPFNCLCSLLPSLYYRRLPTPL